MLRENDKLASQNKILSKRIQQLDAKRVEEKKELFNLKSNLFKDWKPEEKGEKIEAMQAYFDDINEKTEALGMKNEELLDRNSELSVTNEGLLEDLQKLKIELQDAKALAAIKERDAADLGESLKESLDIW